MTARIDWERRHKLMRFHTATHLLCHLVPQPVNGCSITPDYARLDFHMTDPLDKEALTAGLARLVAAGHPLAVGAITDAELDANPALVKSMSVQPPRGTGTVRTIRIGGEDDEQIDFQPCGGTHVANTREIGAVVVTKIEKKSANTPPRGAGLGRMSAAGTSPAAPAPTDRHGSLLRLFASRPSWSPPSQPACRPRPSWPPSIGPVVTTPHVRAELIAHAPEGVAPGAPVWVGLQITHQPEWHTYWKNAGDSGLPTELRVVAAGRRLAAATSPGRCRRRSRSAPWPTTATKARCCCRCR